jgi:hypothetical protein
VAEAFGQIIGFDDGFVVIAHNLDFRECQVHPTNDR